MQINTNLIHTYDIVIFYGRIMGQRWDQVYKPNFILNITRTMFNYGLHRMFFLHLSCMIRAKLLACPYLEYFKCIKEKFCLSRLSTDNLMLKKY